MIDKPGVYRISNEVYHGNPCVKPCLSRSTILSLLNDCPRKAWEEHPVLNPNYKADDGNGKFDIGSASHSLLLEGIDVAAVIDAEDWKKKEAQQARKDARKEGKVPLLKHQYAEVFEMIVAAREYLASSELGIKSLREEGESELSYFWKEDGIWLKVRTDWTPGDLQIILDYKTSGSANPSELGRHIISMGYDVQAALYIRGVKAVTGIEPKFLFLFQETSAPYLCSLVGLPPGFLEMAKSKVETGIELWRECLRTDTWPGYPNRIAWVEPPEWALMAWESRKLSLWNPPESTL